MLTKHTNIIENFSYDCRRFVEQGFDALKNELDGNRGRVNTQNVAKGRMIMKFVALILWATLAAKLREIKSAEPINTTIQSLDNIMVMGYGNEWILSEVTKRNRTLCEKLNISIPSGKITLKDEQYIPQTVINELFAKKKEELKRRGGEETK